MLPSCVCHMVGAQSIYERDKHCFPDSLDFLKLSTVYLKWSIMKSYPWGNKQGGSRTTCLACFRDHIAITYENTSKYVDTLTLFSKNLNQRSLTPRWPLTPCLLRSHVWLYPRIIVSKSHDNTSMYVDTVINFAKYHIHTYTYILRTEWVITKSLTELSSGETKKLLVCAPWHHVEFFHKS